MQNFHRNSFENTFEATLEFHWNPFLESFHLDKIQFSLFIFLMLFILMAFFDVEVCFNFNLIAWGECTKITNTNILSKDCGWKSYGPQICLRTQVHHRSSHTHLLCGLELNQRVHGMRQRIHNNQMVSSYKLSFRHSRPTLNSLYTRQSHSYITHSCIKIKAIFCNFNLNTIFVFIHLNSK